MARKPRQDEPGSWHHVFNRGLSRRTVFELRSDVRYFLSRLAREVRRGAIEVHAYCFLTTHFHLLVRSPIGQLSRALGRIQNAYVRRFNRERKRDGSLFRGRFGSVRIRHESYWEDLLRYIDANAFQAGLVGDPRLFPHGSASHYAQSAGPIWMERSVVEAVVAGAVGASRFGPATYRRFLESCAQPERDDFIERRVAAGNTEGDPLADLIDAAEPEILDWMLRKAHLADGRRPGVPVVSVGTLEGIVARHRIASPEWCVRPVRKGRSGWTLLRAGLLRSACGLTYAEIGRRCERSTTVAQDMVAAHRTLLEASEEYGTRVAEVLAAALRRDHGGRVLSKIIPL